MCPHCGSGLTAPNVRAARRQEEVAALRRRYVKVTSVRTPGLRDRQRQLQNLVESEGRAVINRSISALTSMLGSQVDISGQYYRGIMAGTRIFGQGKVNTVRVIADTAFFPNYHESIRFACLTTTNAGLLSYGPCSVVLKTHLIEHRASLLDENSLYFVNRVAKDGDLFSLYELPPGHRADWDGRGTLSVVKFGAGLLSQCAGQGDDPIFRRGSSQEYDEFIEIHIFSEITKEAIECVVIPKCASSREEVVPLAALRDRIESLQLPYEVY